MLTVTEKKLINSRKKAKILSDIEITVKATTPLRPSRKKYGVFIMAWACDQLKTTTGRNLGISSNNSQGRLFEGGDYFKYCSLEVVPEIFCSIFPLNQNNK